MTRLLSESAKARAETLFERLDRLARAFRPPPELPAEAVDAALEPWRRAVARGDAAAFARRLAWDGVDARIAALAFVAAERGAEGPWSDVMERWLQAAALEVATPEPAASAAALPFAELVAPWVAAAGRRVETAAPALGAALSPRAWQEWRRGLATRLSWISALACHARFERERAEGGEPGAYARSIARDLGDGFAALAEELPGLARQLALRAEDWVEASVELVGRILADRERLAVELGGGVATGAVVELSTGLSDPHARGRRVVALRFESGLEVVLKPRSLALEVLYESFCRDLAEAGFDLAPGAARALDRGGYGWMERVRPAALADEAEAEAWFRRAGAFAAIAWLIGGRDLHAENLIAGRAGPLLVDAEMLLSPQVEAGADSVVATGLVADPEAAAGPGAWGYAGLGVPDAEELPEDERSWTDLGTDRLRLEWRRPTARPLANVVHVAGRVQRPEVFRDALLDGFERAARFLADRRGLVEGRGGLLERARTLATRVLLRPSARYATTLALSVRPRYLADGVAASLLREALLQPLTALAERPALWPLAAEERAALESLDLPVFRIGVGETALRAGSGERVEGVFAVSGCDAVRARLAGLDEAEIARQRARFAAALVPRRLPPAEEERRLTAAAAAMAAALAASPAFVAPAPEAGRLRALALYGGLAGRALFAAGADRATGDPRWRDLATRLADSLAGAIEGVPQGPGDDADRPGATDGWGSIVWSAVLLAELLERPDLVATARRAAAWLDRVPDESGRWGFDLAAGQAGALLGLLALAEAEPASGALAAARRRGERLLAAQIPAGQEAGAWPAPGGGPALAGFAHGASGAARALDALAAATGEPRFASGADRAMAWERTLLAPLRRDWPVRIAGPTAGGVEHAYLGAWCHGAPGIGLARVARLAGREDGAARADLDTALAFAAGAALPEVDHLCCGTASRLALLAAAGRALGAESALADGRALARRALARAEGRGGWAVTPGSEPSERSDVGFFRGYPGLAWSLISLTSSGAELPLVAGLELPSERRRRLRSPP